MTPQLQMSIRLLQLGRLDLVEMIKEEVQENPVLDDTAVLVREGPDESPAASSSSDEIDWHSFVQGYESGTRSGIDFSEARDDPIDNLRAAEPSLGDHLNAQLGHAGLDECKLMIGAYIIGNIDEDGFLRVVDRVDLDDDAHETATNLEIAEHTDATAAEVQRVLDVIRHFDPVGVGARDIRQALAIQARDMAVRDTLVEAVISDHLKLLARKNFKAIAKRMDVTVEDVIEVSKIIVESLRPIPGAGYGPGNSRAITPDVYVQKIDGEYVVYLNDDGMPRLRINSYYRKMLRNGACASADARGFIKERLSSALWLIRSIHQRQRTILKVAKSVVRFQRDFLDRGISGLRPLVLKDIAEEIGVHESTVSRVTSNKYIHTARGIFELKYFFTNCLSTYDGSVVAVEYIKEKVRGIVASEDSTRPLSDQQIANKLGESGVIVARRTVNKYRVELGLLSASLRKRLF